MHSFAPFARFIALHAPTPNTRRFTRTPHGRPPRASLPPGAPPLIKLSLALKAGVPRQTCADRSTSSSSPPNNPHHHHRRHDRARAESPPHTKFPSISLLVPSSTASQHPLRSHPRHDGQSHPRISFVSYSRGCHIRCERGFETATKKTTTTTTNL